MWIMRTHTDTHTRLVACGITEIPGEMQVQRIYAQILYLQNPRLDSLSLNSCKKWQVIFITDICGEIEI